MGDKPIIAISHLGCEKTGLILNICWVSWYKGYGVDNNEELADYVIVNTCSFIQAAQEESVRTLCLAEADKKIVITAVWLTLPERLLEELPEAVAVVGSGDYHKIVDVIERVGGERVRKFRLNRHTLPMKQRRYHN